MADPLFFEDLQVGDIWTSPARTITESDVVQFAGMTGDFNPLHVDHEHAKTTPFRKPIAHGLLGLSWVAGLGSNHPFMRTEAFLGIDSWEFLQAAFIGDTVHVETEVLDLEAKGRRRGKVTWLRKLVNQNNDAIQQGRFITLVACRTASRVDAAEPSVRRPHVPITSSK